jgi:hypothetical protein
MKFNFLRELDVGVFFNTQNEKPKKIENDPKDGKSDEDICKYL